MINYTDLAERLVADIAARVPDFAHVDPARVAVVAAPRHAGGAWGNLACCASLRDRGEPTFSAWVRRGTRTIVEVSTWHVVAPPKVVFEDRPRRYLIVVRLPRHLEHDPLETLVHEMFHVGERFDGALRPVRHGKTFDLAVRRLMRDWLRRADPELAELAVMRFAELRAKFGPVVARTLPSAFRSTLRERVDPPLDYERAVAERYPTLRLAPDFRVRTLASSPAKVPREITERDCSLRMFHPEGACVLGRGGRAGAAAPPESGRVRSGGVQVFARASADEETEGKADEVPTLLE